MGIGFLLILVLLIVMFKALNLASWIFYRI